MRATRVDPVEDVDDDIDRLVVTGDRLLVEVAVSDLLELAQPVDIAFHLAERVP